MDWPLRTSGRLFALGLLALTASTGGAAAHETALAADEGAMFERLYGERRSILGLNHAVGLDQPGQSGGGPTWSTLFGPSPGQGMSAGLNASITYNGNLVVAGDFLSAGGAPANRIAEWNGASWTPLGAGLSDRVFALGTFGGNLIAGGKFTEAGGGVAHHVAQWNGTSWSPLGAGLGGTVYAVIEYQGQLLAGGDFPGYIARWNGTNWATYAPSFNNTVLAFAIHQASPTATSLLVGGRFTGVVNTGDYIVRRDSTGTWRAINSGARAFVTSMHVRGDSVYVGGVFQTVGPANNPVPSKHVAVIDMLQFSGFGQWKAIGATGTNGPVRAVAESAGLIVIGGQFGQIGTTNANNIATFNPVGGGLGTLGAGLSGATFAPLVRTLHVNGGNVWAGGWFEIAGGNPSIYVARWGSAPGPVDAPVLEPSSVFAWYVGPNPVVDDTRISLALTRRAPVRLTVHDVRGRLVETLWDGERDTGAHTVTWDGRGAAGSLPSGVYYVRLDVDGRVESKSVVLAR